MTTETGVQATVFIVDDHDLVRDAVAHLIAAAPGLHVVGEAATAAEAYSQILAMAPDVVIMDVRLPDGNGIDLCRQLHGIDPDIRCLVLTSHAPDGVWDEALGAGAAGLLLKNSSARMLIEAIREVAMGRSLFDVSMSAGPG